MGSAPDLRKFFAPSAVAVVGASADRSRFGGKVMQRMQGFGIAAPVYPVTPSSQEIGGIPCFGSKRDLPRVPDHVGIMVPTDKVFAVLDDCASVGAPFATIFSAGFGETGTAAGKTLQKRLCDFARDTGVRIMGPNCNGLINFIDGFAMTSSATIAGPRRKPGNIGLAAQSGGAAQVNVMRRAPSPAFESQVPYVVAIVALDEGPHLMTNVVDCDPERVRIGDRVSVRFLDVDNETALPVFAPEKAAERTRG